MRRMALITSLCLLVTAPAIADLTTVNVDFQWSSWGLYSDVGIAPDTGTYWNEFNEYDQLAGTLNNLLASDGATVTDIGVTAPYYTSARASLGYPNYLLNDRLYGPSSLPGPAISVSGLDQEHVYDIYLYVGWAYPQEFTIDGVTKSLIAGDYTGADAEPGNWVEGVQYVSFSGLTASDTGIIDIYNTGLSTYSVLSGLQIQAEPSVVPLPGAALLGTLGLSAAGIKLRRRG